MGIEFPSQISRELDAIGSTSKPDHTGFLGDMQIAIPSCVPCKAGQACRGKVAVAGDLEGWPTKKYGN